MLFIKIFPLATARIIFAITITATWLHANGQVYGCKDSLANNYNALATINNGGCTYNITSYIPPVKVARLSDSLVETSGLQMAGNFLWSFNDGGGAPAIYRIDTLTNALLQRVYLQGALNIDWEDIAFDGINFYIGDFGNNANGARTDLKIYKFPLAAIPGYVTSPVATIPGTQIDIIRFSYSNQIQPPQPVSANKTSFDCEAMLVDSGKIHLFTKNWIGLNTTHYVINSLAAGTYKAIPVDTLETNFLVTAADKAPNQKTVALLGYQNSGTGNHFMYPLSDYDGTDYFSGNKRKINLPDATVMGQAEGISFRNDVYGYISNEKFVRNLGFFTVNVPQKLRSFNIAGYVSNKKVTYLFNGDGKWNLAANWGNNKMPDEITETGSEIIIDPAPGGQCILNIPYTLGAGRTFVLKPGKHLIIQQQ